MNPSTLPSQNPTSSPQMHHEIRALLLHIVGVGEQTLELLSGRWFGPDLDRGKAIAELATSCWTREQYGDLWNAITILERVAAEASRGAGILRQGLDQVDRLVTTQPQPFAGRTDPAGRSQGPRRRVEAVGLAGGQHVARRKLAFARPAERDIKIGSSAWGT